MQTTDSPSTSRIFRTRLEELDAEHRLRNIPADSPAGIDLCSNDYMGLGARCAMFMPEFLDLYPDLQMSSSASRLLSGHQRYHLLLEDKLKGIYGKETLLFNSGYHANVGIVQALASAGAFFLCDRLIHASVIDGLKCGGARFTRFRHNDPEDAEKRLSTLTNEQIVVIVTESIFSMDGDEAPLQALVDLKNRFPNALLYVDEAHAFGVRGPRGAGIAAELDLTGSIDLLVGTFGKACASTGAFVACDSIMKQFLLNSARSFIFSTALPPANAAWTLFMIDKLAGMDMERKHLQNLATLLSDGISEMTGEDNNSRTQIVPLLTHDAARALAISARLAEAGFNALPIRRPTVPPGGERIRFSLNALLTEEDIRSLLTHLRVACSTEMDWQE